MHDRRRGARPGRGGPPHVGLLVGRGVPDQRAGGLDGHCARAAPATTGRRGSRSRRPSLGRARRGGGVDVGHGVESRRHRHGALGRSDGGSGGADRPRGVPATAVDAGPSDLRLAGPAATDVSRRGRRGRHHGGHDARRVLPGSAVPAAGPRLLDLRVRSRGASDRGRDPADLPSSRRAGRSVRRADDADPRRGGRCGQHRADAAPGARRATISSSARRTSGSAARWASSEPRSREPSWRACPERRWRWPRRPRISNRASVARC